MRVARRVSERSGPLTAYEHRRTVQCTMRWLVLVLVACSSTKKADPGSESSRAAANPPAKAPAMHKYNVTPVGDTVPISIQVAIPSDWSEDTSSPDGPTFQIPGVEVRQLTINALSLRGDSDERMAKAISMQYDDGAGADRSNLSGGRVWMVRREKVVDHARMFVPYDEGVVMGVAFLAHASADRLPAIKQAFDTITVTVER